MRLKDICRATKTDIHMGEWKCGVKMPRSSFPVSKGSVRVGPCFRWCLSTFQCKGHQFRLLVYYRGDKEQYAALLGMADGNDSKLLARYEFHGSHVGWHIHAACETDRVTAGRTGGDMHTRFPKVRTKHRRSEFGVTDDAKALYIAAKVFGLTGVGALL